MAKKKQTNKPNKTKTKGDDQDDPYCIAADVRYPDINLVLEENVTYVCFNFYGTGDGVTTACRTDFYNERCYKKPCESTTTISPGGKKAGPTSTTATTTEGPTMVTDKSMTA